MKKLDFHEERTMSYSTCAELLLPIIAKACEVS